MKGIIAHRQVPVKYLVLPWCCLAPSDSSASLLSPLRARAVRCFLLLDLVGARGHGGKGLSVIWLTACASRPA